MDWLRIVPQLTVIRNGIKTFSFELKTKQQKQNKNPKKKKKKKRLFYVPAKTQQTATLQPSRDAGKHTLGS